jgi:cysteine dioxygenase
MPTIKTIIELIETFENVEPSEQVGVLKSIDIPRKEFEAFATWKEGGYTRNCIVRHEKFELILLCWDTGVKTPIHGHDGQNCWVYLISGTISEKRFKQKHHGFELTNDATLEAGSISYMHDRMGFHTLENVSSGLSMTLHVYAHPIDICEVYNEKIGSFETVKMVYDSTAEIKDVTQIS